MITFETCSDGRQVRVHEEARKMKAAEAITALRLLQPNTRAELRRPQRPRHAGQCVGKLSATPAVGCFADRRMIKAFRPARLWTDGGNSEVDIAINDSLVTTVWLIIDRQLRANESSRGL